MSSLREGEAASGTIPPGLGVTRPGRAWLSALAAGLAAGLLSWLLGEAAFGAFVGPEVLAPMSDEEKFIAIAGRRTADAMNVALAMGVRGGILGLALGLGGALARGATRSAALAGLAGLAAGVAAGLVATFAVMPGWYRFVDANPLSHDLGIPLLIHLGLWAPLGAIGGLAFGLALGGRRLAVPALLGGLVGAAAGTVVYEFVGALAFPLALTSMPVSATWGTRLAAHLLVAVAAAAGTALLCRPKLTDAR